jgi:hypothetical protein
LSCSQNATISEKHQSGHSIFSPSRTSDSLTSATWCANTPKRQCARLEMPQFPSPPTPSSSTSVGVERKEKSFNACRYQQEKMDYMLGQQQTSNNSELSSPVAALASLNRLSATTAALQQASQMYAAAHNPFQETSGFGHHYSTPSTPGFDGNSAARACALPSPTIYPPTPPPSAPWTPWYSGDTF